MAYSAMWTIESHLVATEQRSFTKFPKINTIWEMTND